MEYHSCYRMLLVLSISAKDSSNKVRARERESANPGDIMICLLFHFLDPTKP